MDVRRRHLGIAGRADRPDAVALGDRRALADRDRAEVRERYVVAVGGRDRDRPARGRHRPRERHRSRGRRDDKAAGVSRDVDASMLTARVGMGRIEAEGLEDSPVDRPAPGRRRGDEDERSHESREQETYESRHEYTPSLSDPGTFESR
jgi:hypothetical protein